MLKLHRHASHFYSSTTATSPTLAAVVFTPPSSSSPFLYYALDDICRLEWWNRSSDLSLSFMGDPNPRIARTIPIRLPPGVRFYPTEQQLLCYYLTKKNSDLSIPSSDADFISVGMNMIQEIDLYNYDPCELLDRACFLYGRGGSKKHWYCFTVKSSSERVKRKARGGFWKRRGPVRDVVDGNEGAVLGKRKTFVFYRGNSSGTVKTDWVMYEYALVDNHRDSFSLCRVFLKSCPATKITDHVPSSCTEKNADVPCKQHYGTSTSGIGEILMNADTSVGTENEIQRLPVNYINEQYDSVIAEQTSYDVSQFPMTIAWQNQLALLVSELESDPFDKAKNPSENQEPIDFKLYDTYKGCGLLWHSYEALTLLPRRKGIPRLEEGEALK